MNHGFHTLLMVLAVLLGEGAIFSHSTVIVHVNKVPISNFGQSCLLQAFCKLSAKISAGYFTSTLLSLWQLKCSTDLKTVSGGSCFE